MRASLRVRWSVYIQRGDGHSPGDEIPGTRCHAPHPIQSTPVMEAAIKTLVSQFKVYAGNDGSSSTLSKEEFCNLVTTQLPNYVKSSDAGAIDKLMSSQDENDDGELTFSEFWKLIGQLACEKEGGLS